MLTWDMPGRSMNVLTEAAIRELDAHVDAILADETLKGAGNNTRT